MRRCSCGGRPVVEPLDPRVLLSSAVPAAGLSTDRAAPAVADTVKPTATAVSAADVTALGGTGYTFAVTYSDNVAVDTATLGGADVRVTGPGGYSQLASFVSVDSTTDGTPRTVTYRVTPPGGSWNPTDNGTYTITLQGSQVADTAGNFADAKALGTFTVNTASTATVTGVVFVDANANGVKDATEKTALSARVYVDLNRDGIYQSGEPTAVSSARSGVYTISGLAAGTYQVRHVPPAGYRQSLPSRYYAYTLSGSQTVSKLYFGDTQRAYLRGRVWGDANANKAADAGEAGLAGWRVFVDANRDGRYQSTERSVLTDAQGYFVFGDLVPGTYTFALVRQAGWTPTNKTSYAFTLGTAQVYTKLAFGQR